MEFNLEEELGKFGVINDSLLAELTELGQVSHVDIHENLMNVFYDYGKYRCIQIERTQCKRLDPQTEEIIEVINTYNVNKKPIVNYMTIGGKNRKPSTEFLEQDQGMWG